MIDEIFKAGRVRRWHQNPDMSWTDDYNDAHQGRVARILLALHPAPSALLLASALTHDDGELFAGDLGVDTKNTNPDLREKLREIENTGICKLWQVDQPLSSILPTEEKEWLRFADRLDSYMWMRHKQPSLSSREDWRESYNLLRKFVREHEIEGIF